eukprot:COSAG01_NODE_7664_length_3109_cov_1.665337_4_plen_92_part_00
MNLPWSRYGGIALKKKILSRTAKLFVLGCLTQGTQRGFYLNGGGVDVSNLRIPGILQRIAFAYGRTIRTSQPRFGLAQLTATVASGTASSR